MIGNSHKILFIIGVFILLFLQSCEVDHVDYPLEPQIEFLNTDVSIGQNVLGQSQVNIKLSFYLIDGDGDMGLTQYDSIPPYDANFFPSLYGIENGEMKEDTNLIADKYRIPWVGDLGQDKILKAVIYIDFNYPFNEQYPFPYDSVVYSFYLVDRALNKSNIAWSDTIVVP
jgi:hypothetical protein